MAELRFKNVSHSYQLSAKPGLSEDKIEWAVKDVNLVWKAGTANALLGPSGCGKTTMLNIISGLLQPTEGKVLMDGENITPLSPRKRHIAQVFQFPVVYDSMDVYNNLAFPLVNKGVPDSRIEKKVKEIAEILDLTEYLRTPSVNLNSAEKQKVSLGRGIIREDTQAILLDEPLTVIDPKRKGDLRRRLKQVQKELNITTIYVTHDQHEALTFADYVAIIKGGRLIQEGTPEELYAEPRSPFVGYFIGSPGMNVLDCKITEKGLRCDDLLINISSNIKQRLKGIKGKMKLGIRPEALITRTRKMEEAIPGVIAVIEDVGNYKIVTVKIGEQRIKGRIDSRIKVVEKERVYVKFPEKSIKLFKDNQRVY